MLGLLLAVEERLFKLFTNIFSSKKYHTDLFDSEIPKKVAFWHISNRIGQVTASEVLHQSLTTGQSRWPKDKVSQKL